MTNSPNTQQTNDHTANPFQSVAARIMSCIYDTALSASPISKTVLPDTTLQLTEPEQQELLSILENFDLPENTKEAILSGNASLRQVIHLIHKDFEQAFALDMENANMDTTNTEESATKNQSAESNAQMLRTSLFDTPVVNQIEQQFTQLQTENNELGGQLNNMERMEFNQILKQFPLDEQVKIKL